MRYTNLYQTPRSPLIQGRTRWERPLWQSWLGGASAAALSFAAVCAVVLRISLAELPLLVAALALVAGSGLGALLARLWGWRLRWVWAGLLAVIAATVSCAVWTYWLTTIVR